MGFRDYKISRQAIEDAEGLGFSGDVEGQLADMASQSAITTYPTANRRYKDFAFNIQDGVVLRMVPFDREINKASLAAKARHKKRQRNKQLKPT